MVLQWKKFVETKFHKQLLILYEGEFDNDEFI